LITASGFHIYNIVWTPVIGEELICCREPSNMMDPYAVSGIKDSIFVGHLPRKILAVCSIFIDLGGRINCCVTLEADIIHRIYPKVVPEIPCKILFQGSTQHVAKLKSLAKYCGTKRSLPIRIIQINQPKELR